MAFQSLSYKKRLIVVDLTESVTINKADAGFRASILYLLYL
ncbi:hypothetical protein SAMN05421882_105211 [Nitrosomonas communis]|uniref:Uncharacterized protein n=1 Tax=Nitrosomonas communis TaxID=44574 RepID=A0A1H2YJC9_9PROT|nr:hypothetical protein SAMN05421882_105211 [Nitrosomonas communis]